MLSSSCSRVICQRGLNEVASIVGCGVPVDFRAVTGADSHGQLVGAWLINCRSRALSANALRRDFAREAM